MKTTNSSGIFRQSLLTNRIVTLRESLLKVLNEQEPEAYFDVLIHAPLSLLKDGQDCPEKWWRRSVPVLVVRYREEDVVGSAAFTRKLASGGNESSRSAPSFGGRGSPVFAIVWNGSDKDAYVQRALSEAAIPALCMSENLPVHTVTDTVATSILYQKSAPKEPGLVSSEQDQVAQKLNELEVLQRKIDARLMQEKLPSFVILQEVHASFVLGSSGPKANKHIQKRSFDFVIFSRGIDEADRHWFPVLGIEYDGKGHSESEYSIRSDEIKNTLCELAELPLLRIDMKYLPWNPIFSLKDKTRELSDRERRNFLSGALKSMVMQISESGRLYEKFGSFDDDDWYYSESFESVTWERADAVIELVGVKEVTGKCWVIDFEEKDYSGNPYLRAHAINITNSVSFKTPFLHVKLVSGGSLVDEILMKKQILFDYALRKIWANHRGKKVF